MAGTGRKKNKTKKEGLTHLQYTRKKSICLSTFNRQEPLKSAAVQTVGIFTSIGRMCSK